MINSKYISPAHSLFITVFVVSGCVETFDFESEIESFESALVIEATITNENKQQEILLSRVYKLSGEIPIPEGNAQVKIVDNMNNEYVFVESDLSGLYFSSSPFSAMEGLEYTLVIITSNGAEYNSRPTNLTQFTIIDNVYAARDFNEEENEGVSIYIDSHDSTGNSKYYRFEYEEAYKIIAPRWDEVDYNCSFDDFGNPLLWFSTRTYDEFICYNVVKSKDILITNTLSLEEDKLEKYRIRFLNRDNFIISHRYSIEVRQYIQSRQAHIYYETLKKISQNESLFSENQTGFIEGNVFAVEQHNEKVVGFFEVSSVDKKRIYFNYKDLFPGEFLPPYKAGCSPFTPRPEDLCYALIQNKFWDYNDPPGPNESNVWLVPRECGDCTALGKSEAPEFWID